MNICVLVGWQRPEFMTVCLEQILKADGNEDLMYYFALDAGYDKKYEEIIKNFPRHKAVLRMGKTNYKLGKQSYNVLNSVIAAAQNTDKLVYYVEEDIFIGKDFFRFHNEVHEQQPEIFCSVGTKCNNTAWITTNDKRAYYLSPNPDFQSWGNCFNKEIVFKYIQPHFVRTYFDSPQAYCKINFPNSVVGHGFCEQDGLTRRIVERTELLIAYPHVPRAFHAGYYGYNRHQSRPATYEQRLAAVKRICFDPVLMRHHCKPGYYKDSVPVDMNIDESDYYFVNVEK